VFVVEKRMQSRFISDENSGSNLIIDHASVALSRVEALEETETSKKPF
jgi:hypothetical protein